MHALVFNITVPIWASTKIAAAIIGRRACWAKYAPLRLQEIPRPDPLGPGWVVCRTRLGGVCGTDLAIIQLQRRRTSILPGFSSMPMTLGHENVAEVVEAHPSVDAGWVGKRVCVEPTLSCVPRGIEPLCRRCAVGEYGACENFAASGRGRYKLPAGTSIGYNSRTGGSWGEYFGAHVCQLVEIPEAISDETAILTDPLACSLHGVLRTDLDDAACVCVFGGGVLGLGTIAALRAVGYTGAIDVVTRHGFQSDLARRLGASHIWSERDAADLPTIAERVGGDVITAHFGAATLTGGYDVVYECTGSPAALNAALKFTRARGQLLLVGTTEGGHVDLTPTWFQELRLIGAYGRQREHFDGEEIDTYRIIHRFMLSGQMPTDGLLTHTAPLTDYANLFATATDKRRSQCVKAAFRFV